MSPCALVSLTIGSVTAIAKIATGMFTSRHQRQSTYCVSTPPSSRPIAAPPPEIAPNTANALARSFSPTNVVVRIASAAGASRAANTPCPARAANNCMPVCAKPPTADAIAKPAIPTMKERLRPQKSAMRPPSSNSAPKASA